MKFRILGRTLLALAGAVAVSLSLTSCSNDKTVGYVYVLGTQYNQISVLREDYNNGTLYNVTSPVATGGSNPVRAVIPSGNRFLYVLNAGTQSAPDATGSVTYSSANISIFSIGGYGQLSSQLQYESQGFGSKRIAVDAGGTHLFVLDEYEPVGVTAGGNTSPTSVVSAGNPNYPCLGTDGFYHPVGDITVFTVDTATGRLELVQNARQLNLTYFPVGCFPVDFRVTPNYVYTMDAGSTSTNDVQTVNVQAVSGGQLTPTQTSSIQVSTNNSSNISAINGDPSSKYIYLIDTVNNKLYLYTIGNSGALTAISGGSPYDNSGNTIAGGPTQTVVDANNHLYVANGGPAPGTSNTNSDVGVYNIDPATGFLDTPGRTSPFTLGTISGPVCIFLDPTNQFIYTAGSLDNSITGRKLDPQTGTLKPLNAASTFPVTGTPSWCLGISSTF